MLNNIRHCYDNQRQLKIYEVITNNEDIKTLKNTVFVMMPFSSEFDDIYLMGIKAACEKIGMDCQRIDEQIYDEGIMTRLYDQINKSNLIIADMTGRNPNVFYEVGYAHAIGKRVIHITQNSSDIPFDLSHHPHITYGGKIHTLYKELLRRLTWHLDNPKKTEFLRDNLIPYVVYRTRAQMNTSANTCLETGNDRLDIIGYGLKSFRDAMTTSIQVKVKSGFKLRILTLNPDSKFVLCREQEEKEVCGQIRNTIIGLRDWVIALKSISSDPNSIRLKYYDSLPQDFLFRHDDALFTGPYLYGIGSQQTISFEFRKGSVGYAYFEQYFECLWNDDKFGIEQW
ncbi:MAG: hypothetical protein NTX45_05770 [Proteobacteria bacterium]|nr:hypothetical protein [Pseudomonadota bacterium]